MPALIPPLPPSLQRISAEDASFSEIRRWLWEALMDLFEEKNLFDSSINERTLTQRLALHLQPKVTAGFSVDCEYNRMQFESGTITKRLDIDCATAPTTATDAPTVYPDIIVHRRRHMGAEANLLVVEAKRNAAGRSIPRHDGKKLRGFTSTVLHFGYRYGVFVNFRLSVRTPSVQIAWFRNGTLVADSWEYAPIPTEVD